MYFTLMAHLSLCCCWVSLVVSDSVRCHRRQPTRLPHPWDSPGKNTGVGCHFLLQCMKVKSESEVARSCPTLHNPMDCSLPGSPIPGIFQARVLEWGAISFSNAWKWKVKVKSLGRVQLFATLWTAARQAPPSMGFSRQEHWSGAICTRHMCLVATKLDSAALDFHFVQFNCSVLSYSLLPHGLQHARLPYSSPTPRACSNSHSLSWWCHPTILSSVIPFSSCLQSFPASGSFSMSQFSTWGVLHKVLEFQHQSFQWTPRTDLSPLGWTGWISLQSKGLSRVFSNTAIQKHQFFGTQLSSSSNSYIHTWLLEKL